MSAISELVSPKRIDFPWIDKFLDRHDANPTVWERVTLPVKKLFHAAAHLTVRRPGILHYISDNGNYADLAAGEIRATLSNIPEMLRTLTGRPVGKTEYHDIPAQDVNAAAFDLAQLSRRDLRGFGNVFFVNCAPRKKQRGVEGKNGGETVYAGILPNGVIVAATGEEPFVHFKDLISGGKLNVYRVNVATDGTQFRSLDYFPWVAELTKLYVNKPNVNAQWRNNLSTEQRDEILFGLGFIDRQTKLKAEDIPELENIRTARSDTHGNVKLDVRHDKVQAALQGEPKVIVFANGHILPAELKTNSFDQQTGNTAISAGSSGRWRKDGRSHRHMETNLLPPFAEIFTANERARDHLGITDANLKTGVDIHFIPANLFESVTSSLAQMDRRHAPQVVAAAIIEAGLVNGLDANGLRQSLTDRSTIQTIQPIITRIESEPIQFHPARFVQALIHHAQGSREGQLVPRGS